jgi:hypothetical protein
MDGQSTGTERRISPLYRANLRRLGDRDIIIASYGAAGQTIVSNLLQELGFNFVDPYTERLESDGSSTAAPEHAAFRRRFSAMHQRDTGKARPRARWPRFVKTHLSADAFADIRIKGVWLVIRDPRDALFSWYKWRVSFAEEEWDKVFGSFEAFLCNPDFTGNLPTQDWSGFYVDWLSRADSSDCLVITRFEDLKKAPLETAGRALRELGLEVSENDLQRALEYSSHQRMREHEDKVVGAGGDAAPRMVRRGKLGEWKEWMTPTLSHYFHDGQMRAVARRFGYLDLQ